MEHQAEKTRIRRPAETVLAVLALLSAALVIVLLVLCIPKLSQKETQTVSVPQSTTALLEESEAETEPETTEEPTIPPEANIYNRRDFQYDRHNYLYCTRQSSYPGVDVSFYQGTIDWKKVRASGIQFAIIRLGIRGWGKAGKLVEDEYAKRNLKEAKAAGLAIGAYFFSQALTIEEVDEEIEFLLGVLGNTPLEMPLVLDWEPIYESGSRSQSMDRRTLTDLLKHFGEVMREKGYDTMIYFNPNQAKSMLYLNELEEFPFWLAMYTDRMNYPYRVEMWQYTDKGKVPGINGDVDLNVFIPAYDAVS